MFLSSAPLWCFASLKNGFQEQKFENLAPEIHPRLSAAFPFCQRLEAISDLSKNHFQDVLYNNTKYTHTHSDLRSG